MKQFGVSQKALLFNKDAKFLIILRGKTAPTNPLKWDLPGGDLEFGEDPITSIVREIQEETGLRAAQLHPFDVEAHINDKGDHWVTIAYDGKVSDDAVNISYEHDEFRWIRFGDFLKLDSIPKIVRFVKKYYKLNG